jgi:hypothetical protein
MTDNTEDRSLRSTALQLALVENELKTATEVVDRAKIFYRFLANGKSDEKTVEQP